MLRTVSVVALPISVAALLASASPSSGLPLRSADVAKMLAVRATQPQVADPAPKVSGTYITFDVPGGSSLSPNGINPLGDIVGNYYDANGVAQYFLLSNGVVRNINPPGAGPCCGAGGWLATNSGINPQGDIVASYNDPNPAAFGAANGFLLSNGKYTDIKVPGAGCGAGTLPAGINPLGDIVGFYFDDATCGVHGFLLSQGTYTTIDVPAALGAIPGGTSASAIDPLGNILGTYNDSSFTVHSFLLSKGKFTAIPDVPAPGTTTYALGMNPQGDIVGWSCCGPLGGFLLSRGTVTELDVPESCGSSCTVPYGITPEGDIVGEYFDNNGQHGFLLKRN